MQPAFKTNLTAILVNSYIFLIGFSTWFSVRFVGDLPVGEILLVAALPVALAVKGRQALRADLKITYTLMLLWLAGQVFADVYNQIEYLNRLRGNALIIFFGLDLLGMSLLVMRNDKRKIMYLVGLTIGALAQVQLQPSPAAAEYPWKFGYATGCMEAALLISSYFYWRRKMLLAALPLLLVCGVNLILNFRSPVLDLMVTMVLLFPVIPERLGAFRLLPRPGTMARILVQAVFVMLAGLAALNLVHFVTRAGFIDEEAKRKNESESQGGNLLLGGRPEFAAGLHAAFDAPIIGHGSWADEIKYMEILADLEVENTSSDPNFARMLANSGDSVIPTHSHIVGAWVFAGILGLVFWLYIILVVLRGIIRLTVSPPVMAPMYMWLLITMFWDICFSPFASFRRLIEAFLLVVIADLPQMKSRVKTVQWKRLSPWRHRLAQGV